MQNLYNKRCDLECQGKKVDVDTGNRHEFVGPVKIILFEPTSADYTRKVWYSALFTFVMLLMGANAFTVFFFALNFEIPFKLNVHVVLCTIGFQVFMTTGMMMYSTLFGGSMMLKSEDKKIQHVFIEASAVLFGVVGTIFALGNMSMSWHALSGFFAAFLAIAAMGVGPLVYVNNPYQWFGMIVRNIHIFCALPAFFCSNVCFATGLMTKSFAKWAPYKDMHYLLIVFCLMYSSSALIAMFLRSHYYL